MHTIVPQTETQHNRINHAALYAAAQRTYPATWTDASGTLVGTARELWTTGAVLEFHTLGCAERFVVRRSDPRLLLGEDVAERQSRAERLGRLAALAVRAVTQYPDERARIERGMQLVADGAVTLHRDDTTTVRSQSGQGTYSGVNGTCPCADFQHGQGRRCKHQWGRMLVQEMARWPS